MENFLEKNYREISDRKFLNESLKIFKMNPCRKFFKESQEDFLGKSLEKGIRGRFPERIHGEISETVNKKYSRGILGENFWRNLVRNLRSEVWRNF